MPHSGTKTDLRRRFKAKLIYRKLAGTGPELERCLKMKFNPVVNFLAWPLKPALAVAWILKAHDRYEKLPGQDQQLFRHRL